MTKIAELKDTTLHVVHDIETLSTDANAVIWQIGAVAFTLDGKVNERFDAEINIESQIGCGRSITADTLRWLINVVAENTQIGASFTMTQNANGLKEVLSHYYKFISAQFATNNCSDLFVWGNGSDFDNVILANAYKQFGLRTPWEYYQSRCLRTLRNLHPGFSKEFVGTKHDALDDAINEAAELKAILESMR